jgi:hypothetical protein
MAPMSRPNTQDLFLQTPQLTFEKKASVSLDEDSRNWTQQILAEAYRACPTIAEFSATVTFSQKDDSQGYANGAVVLEATVDSALAATRVGASKRGRVVIPAIVKNYQLMPLDVFMTADGRTLPLTDARLREALFSPDVGDSVTRDVGGDTSLYNLLYPLGRAGGMSFGGGIGGGGLGGDAATILGPGMKFAHDENYSLLAELAPTLHRPDILVLAEAIQNPGVKAAMATNPAFLSALETVVAVEDSALESAEPLFKAASDMARATVIQIGYSDELEKYWVKSAAAHPYSTPAIDYLDRGQLLKIAGADAVKKVDTEGTVTVAGGEVPPTTEEPWSIITEAGIYKVRTTDGQELLGWVIPNLIDLDGTTLPQAVFSNGAVSMMQDRIVGQKAATGVDLPMNPPKGVGVFYAGSGEGGLKATVPVHVVGQEKTPGAAASWVVTTDIGEQGRLSITPGLQGIEPVGGPEGVELFLPENAGFISLESGAAMTLCDDPAQCNNEAAKIAGEFCGADIRHLGDHTYKLSFVNAPKLASVLGTRPMDHDDAMFALTLAGLSAGDAATKLAQSELGRMVRDVQVRDIALFSDMLESAKLAGATTAKQVAQLKMSLIKEAVSMPSAMTVDAVLSLGFVNPENVRLLLSRLPYLEKALSMVCEMVVASRLGLTTIPEGAASRAARALDAVITGLRGLALLEIDQAS